MTFSYAMPYPAGRSPVMGRNMVATSQPLAVQAGIDALRAGGNAVDAALAAAIALVIVEPTSNGIGSDAFAIVWDGEKIHGLNASGRAPEGWTPDRFAGLQAMPARGWDSVTVPGAVSAWVALSERFGRLPFEALFERGIEYAAAGYPVSPIIGAQWARVADSYSGQPGFDEAFLPGGRPPRPGETFRLPDMAASLRLIAETRGRAFYEGELATAMADHAAANGGVMRREDLAAHRADWCEPLSQSFGGHDILELPPNGQGIATLMTLGILGHLDIDAGTPDSAGNLHLQIEATKLALADLAAHVADPDTMRMPPAALLDPAYLAARAEMVDPGRASDFGPGDPVAGGTVYIATADADGMMVSFIQSNYQGFGSGVVVPGTGISLQDRGAGFTLADGHPNQVGPGKRPFQTIIPGFAMRAGAPAMAFGVMGGPMQAQGHVQMVLRTLLHRQNPQAASDAPRWRVLPDGAVALEATMATETVAALADLGHRITHEAPDTSWAFGGAQLICRTESGYVGGSDHRKDGYAAAF